MSRLGVYAYLWSALALSVGIGPLTVYAEDSAPKRIVSIGAAVTETVDALGAGDRLVGIDATSQGIIDRDDVKRLGFYKRITAEGVLSVNADLVLATHDAGFPATFDQLRQAGVRVVRLPKLDSADAAISQVQIVAQALGRVDRGRSLVAEIRRTLARLAADRAQSDVAPKVLFIYARGAGALLVGGRETTADAMIALIGGSNAAAAVKGFKPLSPEYVLANPPQVLLLAAHGYRALGEMPGLKAHPVLSKTPAVRNGAVIVRDAVDLLSFGPKFAQRAAALAKLIKAPTDAGL